MAKYDTQVSKAVKNSPLEFVDVLNGEAEAAGDMEPMLREAACVIANLLLTEEDWHPAPDGSIKKALADWRLDLNHIIETLGTEELLAQLAEEASELGKAALTLRRALNGKNPTPVSPADALLNVQEEMADVLLCALSVGFDQIAAERTIRTKIPRWAGRIDHDEDSDCPGPFARHEVCGCDFCRTFDFGTVKCVVDRHGSSIYSAGGSSRYPNWQQFRFCPNCGVELHRGGNSDVCS